MNNKEQILHLSSTLTVKQISEKLNISDSYIRRILKQYNIKAIKPRPTCKISIELENKILSLLKLNSKSIVDIAKELNVSKVTVHRIKKEHNIKSTHYSKHFNRNYFEIIDTEHKAYWLGFIVADGSIQIPTKTHVNPARLAINISSKDRMLLEQFLIDIEAENIEIEDYIPKNTFSNKPMCRIVLNSSKMCTDLLKYNISVNKTGHEQIPNISQDLFSHFIRGYLDGDGSIIYSNNKYYVSFTCANKQFLEDLKIILNFYLNTSLDVSIIPSGCQNKRIKNSFQLTYGGINDVKALCYFIYSNSTIYLFRKYIKCQPLLFAME